MDGHPLVVAGIAWRLATPELPFWAQILVTLALVTSSAASYCIAHQSAAEAQRLRLLIASVAVHFTLTGLGLLVFGAEGCGTPAFSSASSTLAASTSACRACWSFARASRSIQRCTFFFGCMLYGKALSATASNRVGARLNGSLTRSPPFALAALLCASSGVLIGPFTTVTTIRGPPREPQGLRRSRSSAAAELPLAAAGALLSGCSRRSRRSAQRLQGSDRVQLILIPVLLCSLTTAITRSGRMSLRRKCCSAVSVSRLRRGADGGALSLATVRRHGAQLTSGV